MSDAQLERIRKACRRGDRTHDHQVALVMRMLHDPSRPIIVQPKHRRRRVYLRGVL